MFYLCYGFLKIFRLNVGGSLYWYCGHSENVNPRERIIILFGEGGANVLGLGIQPAVVEALGVNPENEIHFE